MGRRAEVDILGQLRSVVSDFVVDNQVLEVPLGRRIKKELSEERVNILRSLIKLVMFSDYTTIETKTYLSENYITYRGVAKELELRDGKPRNVHTVQSKIAYDKGKLCSAVGLGIITDVVDYSTRDISSYLERIEQAIYNSDRDRVLKRVKLSFSGDMPKVDDLDNDKFIEGLELMKLYSKESISNAENKLVESGFVSYVKYLESSSKPLTSIEIKRLARLKEEIR